MSREVNTPNAFLSLNHLISFVVILARLLVSQVSPLSATRSECPDEAGDDKAHNFGGSFTNLQELLVAVKPLHIILFH